MSVDKTLSRIFQFLIHKEFSNFLDSPLVKTMSLSISFSGLFLKTPDSTQAEIPNIRE